MYECTACSNGTSTNGLEGLTKCLRCPQGRLSISSGQEECDGCPAGKYINHTGEGYSCWECPVGRSTGSETGFPQCKQCHKFDDDFVGGNFYFQPEKGQESCKLCKHSGNKGAFGCDDVSGAIVCYGLYTIDSRCRDLQNVLQSMLVAWGIFWFTTIFFVPIIFYNGGLATVASEWRKHTIVLVQWMREETSKAASRDQIEKDHKMEKEADHHIDHSFHELHHHLDTTHHHRHFDFFEGAKIPIDDKMAHIFEERLAIPRDFLPKLIQSSAFEATTKSIHGDGNSVMITLPRYRRLLSLIAERQTFAKHQEEARELFRKFDEDDDGALAEDEMKLLARAKGVDVEFLADFLPSEEVDVGGFAKAMWNIDARAKAEHLKQIKATREQEIVAAFLKYGEEDAKEESDSGSSDSDSEESGEDDDGYLGKLTNAQFRAASCSLSLPYSMKTLRRVSQAANEQRRGHSQSAWKRALKTMLHILNSSCWQIVCGIIVIASAMTKSSGKRDWVSKFLVAEVFTRMLIRTFRCELKDFILNWRNAADLLICAVDVMVFMVFSTTGQIRRHCSTTRLLRLLPFLFSPFLPQNQDDAAALVRFRDFRRFVSEMAIEQTLDQKSVRRANYKSCFRKFDGKCGGHSAGVLLEDLEDLLLATGHLVSKSQLMLVDDVLRSGKSQGAKYFFYDEFLLAIEIVDSTAERTAFLLNLKDPNKKSEEAIAEIVELFGATLLGFFYRFLGSVAKLCVNLYLLTQTFFGNEGLKRKLLEHAEVMAFSVGKVGFLSPFLSVIVSVAKPLFKVLFRLGGFFQFNFEDVQGVTCTGVQSLTYLPIVYIIIGIVILLFDSCLYIFLKTGPSDYRTFKEKNLKTRLP